MRLVLKKKQVAELVFEHQPITNLDMCHPVVVEVGASSEAFAAGLALVRLLPGVNTSVGVQRGTG